MFIGFGIKTTYRSKKMKFYYFNGGDHIENGKTKVLEKHGFTGVLFTYESQSRDYFTKIARHINEQEKLKYMVAIRPYAISPQYLNMINTSLYSIMPNKLQINLVSGFVKENEKEVGGILGSVDDHSSHVDKSNYLIKYMEELVDMRNRLTNTYDIDLFVTATNEYVFEKAKKLNQKMIIPYNDYKEKCWTLHAVGPEYDDYHSGKKEWVGKQIDLNNTNVMIVITPFLRETKKEVEQIRSNHIGGHGVGYFTYQEFTNFIKQLESEGINHIMLQPWPLEEDNIVMQYVKDFTRQQSSAKGQ